MGIGSRVWDDRDMDGLQDAEEPGIPGVRLQLVSGGSVLGEAFTNLRGDYFFGRVNVPGGLLPRASYTVRVRTENGPLLNAQLTARDQGSDDRIDSDGALVGGRPEAVLTTGLAGQSDMTVDFGFAGAIPAPVSLGLADPARAPFFGLALLGVMSLVVAARTRRNRARLRAASAPENPGPCAGL